LFVAAAGDALEVFGVFEDEVDDAAAVFGGAAGFGGGGVAEEAVEGGAGADFGGDALGGAAPGDGIGEGDGVVAGQALAGRFGAEFDAGEAGGLADALGDDLIDGDAVDVVFDGGAGQEGAGEFDVAFAATVEAAEDKHVVFEGGEGFEDGREGEVLAGAGDIPSFGEDAVGLEEGDEAAGWELSLRGAGGGSHDFEPRESEGGSDSTEEGAAFDAGAHDVFITKEVGVGLQGRWGQMAKSGWRVFQALEVPLR
jgi:hypothetical protein